MLKARTAAKHHSHETLEYSKLNFLLFWLCGWNMLTPGGTNRDWGWLISWWLGKCLVPRYRVCINVRSDEVSDTLDYWSLSSANIERWNGNKNKDVWQTREMNSVLVQRKTFKSLVWRPQDTDLQKMHETACWMGCHGALCRNFLDSCLTVRCSEGLWLTPNTLSTRLIHTKMNLIYVDYRFNSPGFVSL